MSTVGMDGGEREVGRATIVTALPVQMPEKVEAFIKTKQAAPVLPRQQIVAVAL